MHRHACLPSLSFLPLATVLAVLFFSGVSSSALTLTSTNLFSLTPNATFSDEGWVACQEADLAGMMEDDLYMVAGVASLSGTYGGDVWVLAKESIRFTGQARNQLRAFASHIECSGTIRKSFIAAGNSITLTTDSIMQADCVLVANTIDYKGTTSNDLFVAGNSVTIQGHIGGDLYVAGPDISIMPAAVIDGNLYFSADEDLILAPQVQLGGVVERKSFPFGPKPSTPQDQGLQLARNFVGSMGLGLLLLWFFPRTTGHAVRTLRTRAPACLLLGSGLLLLLPLPRRLEHDLCLATALLPSRDRPVRDPGDYRADYHRHPRGKLGAAAARPSGLSPCSHNSCCRTPSSLLGRLNTYSQLERVARFRCPRVWCMDVHVDTK